LLGVGAMQKARHCLSLLAVAALTCGIWLLRGIYPVLPEPFLRTLAFACIILPFIGIGVALNTIKLRGYVPVFCGVFLLLAIVAGFI